MKVTRFFCLDHVPTKEGWSEQSNDDGRPSCSVCGKANYAVKPYVADLADEEVTDTAVDWLMAVRKFGITRANEMFPEG